MEIHFRAGDGVELFATVLGNGSSTLVFSAGIADRVAVRPLGDLLAADCRVVLPDIRGVGQSVLSDPARLGWSRYVDDLRALLDKLEVDRAVIGGAGMGSTIALRAGVGLADRVKGLVIAGVEALEVDGRSQAASMVFPELARRVEEDGLVTTWATLLPAYPPFIQKMVEDSIVRADAASAAAIFRMLAHDRAFSSVTDLAAITAPTLIVPGQDERHPTDLALRCVQTMPNATLAGVVMSNSLRNADDFAHLLAPAILDFVERMWTLT